MRLLNVHNLRFAEYYTNKNRPKYAIASHRWSTSEATFRDVRDTQNPEGPGYKKIEAFAQYVRDNIPSVEWLWIDTCCINKDSAAELSEAINLMFEWYREAEVCLAYLADVDAVEDKTASAFTKSEWFTRGWTLQELLAPSVVVFLTSAWQVIGNKSGSAHALRDFHVGRSLEQEIAVITRIPVEVLYDFQVANGLSSGEKIRWMDSGRTTTREEDTSYALYGILGCKIGANYGEGGDGARQRLRAAIHQDDTRAQEKAEYFKKLASWLSPPDPWTIHDSARQDREPGTGKWLLYADKYQAWKSGSVKHLWVHGPSGCGKTILCSSAIEDIQAYCMSSTKMVQGVFYFSFSDISKQSYESLLRSLIVQLGFVEPGLSLLRQAYENFDQKLPGRDELQKILLACVTSYDVVFLHLDALDECPDEDGARLDILTQLESLLRQAPKLRMLATSQNVAGIRDCMEALGVEKLSIAAHTVDSDIQNYVLRQISRDRKLSRLDGATKTLIEKTFAEKANGMFRWAYCQLRELKRFKSTQPKRVEAALLALPSTLGETYARMLANIHVDDSQQAFTLLRWIAYSKTPLSLNELSEACIVDPSNNSVVGGVVDINNRGDWKDPLEILSGFVLVEGIEDGHSDDGTSGRKMTKMAKIRLAHFSIKEYLESGNAKIDSVRKYRLHPTREHAFLAQSCLLYLEHYNSSLCKSLSRKDCRTFPLLEYTAKSWYYHMRLQGDNATNFRAMSFLSREHSRRHWLCLHKPELPSIKPFRSRHRLNDDSASGIYYASLTGLIEIVKLLLEQGADVNSQGGQFGNALQAASSQGYIEIVKLLLKQGADVNSQGGDFGNALQATAYRGHIEIVKLLLEQGADVHSQGGQFGNVFPAASYNGHIEIVKLLLEQGADVHSQGGQFGNALQAASSQGYIEIVKVLLEQGADVNSQGSDFGNALQATAYRGHIEIVELLLKQGADINFQGGMFGNAIHSASCGGHTDIVKLLLEHGLDINSQSGDLGNALLGASIGGYIEIVKLLLEYGVDTNSQGGKFGNTLQTASYFGYIEIVKLLLENGVDVNRQGGYFGYPLQTASFGGDIEIVKLLLEQGADVNARGGKYGTALQAASSSGHAEIVQLLESMVHRQ